MAYPGFSVVGTSDFSSQANRRRYTKFCIGSNSTKMGNSLVVSGHGGS